VAIQSAQSHGATYSSSRSEARKKPEASEGWNAASSFGAEAVKMVDKELVIDYIYKGFLDPPINKR
jgi:hypothetical protein